MMEKNPTKQKIHEFKEFQFGWLPCTNVMSGPSDTDGCY